MKQTVKLYRRSIDAGHGRQDVVVIDGTIKEQAIYGNGNHSYTGNGNPELIGKPVAALRGYGFKQVRMSNSRYLDWLESRNS